MPSDIVLYIFRLLVLLYLHVCRHILDAISVNINRQNEWYGVMPLEPEPTRLEAIKIYVHAIYQALMGKPAPHQGGGDFEIGAVEMYGGYPQANEAGDPFIPAWQGDMGVDDAAQMPDVAGVKKPQDGGRMTALRRTIDRLRRRSVFARR